MYVVFRVVDKAERRHGTRFEPQVAFHALRRGEGEFALPQSAFQIVNRQRAVAVETDQIMTVALVVAEEEVFAMFRPVLAPICLGLFDGRGSRVVIDVVPDFVSVEKFPDDRFAFHIDYLDSVRERIYST